MSCHPIAVGPYQVAFDVNAGSQIIVTPSDNWWREPPIVQELELIHVGDRPTQLIMWENGEVDIVFGDLNFNPAIFVPRYEDNLVPYWNASLYFFAFDITREPFDDINVRKAFAHAVDWDVLVKGYGALRLQWQRL